MPAEFTKTVTVRPATALEGVVRVPGDKSISHRYAMLAALADGVTRISHYAPGNDCQSTLKCLEQLGTIVSRHASFDRDTGAEVPTVQIVGRGLRGLQSPTADLDCGNSGSTLRMLAGILAAHPFRSVLTGDASLRRRPMLRVVTPLQQMGAEVTSFNGRPPVSVTGGDLQPITYRPESPSAQVKTAVLLAGLQTAGPDDVRGAGRDTRSHGTGPEGVRGDRRRARARHPDRGRAAAHGPQPGRPRRPVVGGLLGVRRGRAARLLPRTAGRRPESEPDGHLRRPASPRRRRRRAGRSRSTPRNPSVVSGCAIGR